MIRPLRAFALVALASCFLVGPVLGQEPAPALPKAGPEHDILKKEVGTWDASIEITDPTGKTETAKAVETNSVLGDGLWRIQDFKGVLMGMPFQGHGVLGYDPAKKKYVGTWVDSMSYGPTTMDGTYDPKTKTMTVWMEGPDPTGKMMKMRSTHELKDDGTRVFSMFSPEGAGPEKLMMKITYKKRG